ncbi:hypothetical protein [Pelomonas sp. BJYL3]|uniref:hypothetical protein n=1 Tax=Pelomonas sp. BJYL3 TaxID=2976697 RepID=UPI0022B52D38|nr:hypothetical protein [Pelomonas sp. BJYL3]
MFCTDKPSLAPTGAVAPLRHYRCVAGSGLALLVMLAGCSNSPTSAPASPPAATNAPGPSGSAASGKGGGAPSSSVPAKSGAGGQVLLGPPRTPRSHAELRRQAAQRLVAANPERSYMGTVPEVLLAIPVLEVELNVDGHVRHIKVLRKPGQALDTVQLAMDAVHRAAPFGNVSALPKPWVFSETFLFNDQRKFKPRTLDE